MLAEVTARASTAADGNNAPYEKSCVGIIISVQAAGQRYCKSGNG